MYHQVVSQCVQSLKTVEVLLDKAEQFATAKQFDVRVLLNGRLAPDMKPLIYQVQSACDYVKAAAAWLSGQAPPKHEDNETTLPELKQRIAKTLDFIKGIKASQLEGAETRSIELKGPNRTLTFTGLSYVNNFVLPNFYFHESISYAILRHNGVEVGKGDYLGAI